MATYRCWSDRYGEVIVPDVTRSSDAARLYLTTGHGDYLKRYGALQSTEPIVDTVFVQKMHQKAPKKTIVVHFHATILPQSLVDSQPPIQLDRRALNCRLCHELESDCLVRIRRLKQRVPGAVVRRIVDMPV